MQDPFIRKLVAPQQNETDKNTSSINNESDHKRKKDSQSPTRDPKKSKNSFAPLQL